MVVDHQYWTYSSPQLIKIKNEQVDEKVQERWMNIILHSGDVDIRKELIELLIKYSWVKNGARFYEVNKDYISEWLTRVDLYKNWRLIKSIEIAGLVSDSVQEIDRILDISTLNC